MTMISIISKNRRKTSIFLLFLFITEIIRPNFVFALSEGPTQPELTKFSPVATSENVDLFTGNFKYSIPLFSIGGYPINLNYSGNVGMEDEASWVGLGWSLNPGAIQRNLRGIPDDFKEGDIISKKTKQKPNITYSAAIVYEKGEIAGVKKKKSSIDGKKKIKLSDCSVNISYNNYKGMGIDYSIGKDLDFFKSADFGANLSSGNNSGLTLKPEISVVKNLIDYDALQSDSKPQWSFGVSSSFNSEAGLADLTLNFSRLKHETGFNEIDKETCNTIYPKYKISKGINGSGNISFARNLFTPFIPIETNFSSYSFSIELGKQNKIIKLNKPLKIPVTLTIQKINENLRNFTPYGYIAMGENINSENSILDIINEGSTGLSNETQILGHPIYTYDVFSINANGLNGQFKAEKGNLGVLSESNFVNNNGDLYGLSILPGLELGLGISSFQIGADITFNFFQEQGGIELKNNLNEKLQFKNTIPENNAYEGVYFKMIGNGGLKNWSSRYNSNYADLYKANISLDKFNFTEEERKINFGNNETEINSNDPIIPFESNRENRSLIVSCLTAEEASKYGLEKQIKYFEFEESGSMYKPTSKPYILNRCGNNNFRKNHHISEINITDAKGNRFVFGIPVYNVSKKEVQFAVGNSSGSNNDASEIDFTNGLVYFKKSDINNNKHGIDNYYNEENTSAYATSYLLTAWLTSDYQDISNNGPTDDDLGNYVKFNYYKDNRLYNWRTPYMDYTKETTANNGKTSQDVDRLYAASVNKNLLSNDVDDRAVYLWGQRESWYVHSIESKEEIALFYLNDSRNDGLPVLNEFGQIDLSFKSRYLEKIEIYTKNDLNRAQIENRKPIPYKTVNFEYSYELCKGVYNNRNNYNSSNSNNGKLTLKKVWFTFGTSTKGENVPYIFDYAVDKNGNAKNEYNPDYHPKGFDMWGNYKPQQSGSSNKYLLENSEYPFVDHNQSEESIKNNNNLYSNAWCLHRISFPSGAVMYVDYESDTYGYVQDKKTMNMLKIVGFGEDDNNDLNIDLTADEITSNERNKLYNNIKRPKSKVIFEIKNGYSVKDYITDDMKVIFLSCLLKLEKNKENYDYISGFYSLKLHDDKPIVKELEIPQQSGPPKKYACVLLENRGKPPLKNNEEPDNEHSILMKLNQISLRGMDHLMQNRPDIAYLGSNLKMADDDKLVNYAAAIFNILPKLYNVIFGHYKDMIQRKLCSSVNLDNSWIRVQNPTDCKYGGGNRVKKITITDNFDKTIDYGLEYDYNLYDINDKKFKTSGVAEYEPTVARSENPLFMPMADEWYIKQRLSRKHQYFYKTTPDLEALYPAPSVGYSNVTVRTLYNSNINRHGTGRTLYQFYTAKDYPVTSNHSEIKLISKNVPIPKINKISAAQSFFIKLNDMHGKMKAKFEYPFKFNQSHSTAPDADAPFAPSDEENYISGEEFKYFEDEKQNLIDEVPYLNQNNNKIEKGIFGREVEYYMNFRGENSYNFGITTELNLIIDKTKIPPIPIFSLIPNMPKIAYSDLRTYTVTKVVRQYGILKDIIVHKDGSSLKSSNIAFDPITGGVLLSSTQTEYDNNNYDLTIPAYWMDEYNEMGPAFNYTGIKLPNISISNGKITNDPSISDNDGNNNAIPFLNPGDELIILGSENKIWVLDKYTDPNTNISKVSFVDDNGNVPNNTTKIELKIIKSRNKNILTVPVANFTHSAEDHTKLTDNQFHSSSFSNKMLYASVNKYTQERKIEHDINSCQQYFSGRVLEMVNEDIAIIIGRLMKYKLKSDGYFTNSMRHLRTNGEYTSPNYERQSIDNIENYEIMELFENNEIKCSNIVLSSLLIEYFKSKAKILNYTLNRIELLWDYSESYYSNFDNFTISQQSFDKMHYSAPNSSSEGIIDYISGLDFLFRIKVKENTSNYDCHYWMPFRDLNSATYRVYKSLGPSYFNNNLFIPVNKVNCNYTGVNNITHFHYQTYENNIHYQTLTLSNNSSYSPGNYYYTNNPITWSYKMISSTDYVSGSLTRTYCTSNYSVYESLYNNAKNMQSYDKVNAIYQNFKILNSDGTTKFTIDGSNGNTEYAEFGEFHNNMKNAEFNSTYAYANCIDVYSNPYSKNMPVIKVTYNNVETIFPLINETCVNLCTACQNREYASGQNLNPYSNNLLGNWMPLRKLSFFGSRDYTSISGSQPDYNLTDIKNEGFYKDFSSLIKFDGGKWYFETNSNVLKKWNFPETITLTNVNGNSIEGKNLLNTYSAIQLSKTNNQLIYAKAINAQNNEILNINFEDHGNKLFREGTLCGFIQDLPFDDIIGSNISINDNYKHSGRFSMKIKQGTVDFSIKQISNASAESRVNEYENQNIPGLRVLYKIKKQDFYSTFSPLKGQKYILSYWIKSENTDNFSLKVGVSTSQKDYSNIPTSVISSFGTILNGSNVHNDIKIDEWTKREFIFQIPSNTDPTQIRFLFNNQNGTDAYIDDIRIYPYKANMVTYVYDQISNRLSAQLDENNFAKFYEYDAEGNIVRTKVETEKGIMTLDETRQNIKGN